MEHEPLVSRETASARVARAVIADGAPGLTDAQLDRLALLVERVCSTPIGVTAIRDPATAAARHVLDALAGLPAVDAAPPGPLADVGSGGGLPGLVLGVVRPERELHLIESTARKAAPKKRAATRKAPAAKAAGAKTATRKAPARKAGGAPKRRSSASARKRAPAKPKTTPAS